MNRVKAFTVLEILITMGVMGIIVSLTYFLYSSFSGQVLNFQKNSIETQEYEQFNTQLRTDFFEAEKIIKDNNSLKFEFYDTKKTVSYNIEANQIIRIQNSLKESYPIKNIELETLNKTSNLVSKLKVNSLLFNEVLIIDILKVYPPNLNMQY